MLERTIEEYTGRGLRRGLGPRRAVRRAGADLPGDRSPRPSSADRARRPVGAGRAGHRGRDRASTTPARRELGEELMRALERFLLLQIIDERWREHLHDMDYLREGIHLRGFAQIEPLVAYKNEAFTLFEDLMNTIWTDFARLIFHVEVQRAGAQRRAGAAAASARSYQPGGSSTGGAASVQLLLGRRSPAPGATRGRRAADAVERGAQRPGPRRAAPRLEPTSSSGATIRAGAGRARSSSAATGHDQRPLSRADAGASRGDSRPAQAARGLSLTPLRSPSASTALETQMGEPGFWDDARRRPRRSAPSTRA